MTWQGGFSGTGFKTREDFRAWLATQHKPPYHRVVIHNTDAPYINPPVTPAQRVKNLGNFYHSKGWSGGPDLFVFPVGVYLGSPLGHSIGCVGWNGNSFHIEAEGKYTAASGQDPKTNPAAAACWKTMAWVTAELLAWMGWPADNDHIKLHKEGKTTHDCPGRLIEKPWFIQQVRLALNKNSPVTPVPTPVEKPPVIEMKPVSHETVAPQRLQEPAVPLVAPDAAVPNPVRAVSLLVAQGWPRHWAAGAIAQAQRESYPDLRPWAQGDYMLHGRLVPKGTPGAVPTAFTIWQLRDGRHENYLAFAKSRNKPWDDFETQVLWCPFELKTSEKLAWKWLQKAENVDQANAAMCWYERPHGYIAKRAKAATTWDEVFAVSEKCDGYAVRQGFARKLM